MINRTDKTITLDLTTEAGRQGARLYAAWLMIKEPTEDNDQYARVVFEYIDELDPDKQDGRE